MPVPFAFFFFLIFAIIVISIAVTIIRTIARAAGGGPVRPYVNASTQLGSDGFWITSCPARPMSVIHYVYLVDGIRRTGQVAFQPGPDGRQFVYTGGVPLQVSILQIVDPYDNDTVIMAPPIIDVPSPDWTPSHQSSHSSHFPSAY